MMYRTGDASVEVTGFSCHYTDMLEGYEFESTILLVIICGLNDSLGVKYKYRKNCVCILLPQILAESSVLEIWNIDFEGVVCSTHKHIFSARVHILFIKNTHTERDR